MIFKAKNENEIKEAYDLKVKANKPFILNVGSLYDLSLNNLLNLNIISKEWINVLLSYHIEDSINVAILNDPERNVSILVLTKDAYTEYTRYEEQHYYHLDGSRCEEEEVRYIFNKIQS